VPFLKKVGDSIKKIPIKEEINGNFAKIIKNRFYDGLKVAVRQRNGKKNELPTTNQ
jgi:hypothetical protein